MLIFGGCGHLIMNGTLFKALVAFLPILTLFSGSILLFLSRRTVSTFLQLLGAGCGVIVVFTHVLEALQILPWMHWGQEHSVGHYLDLSSAVLALTLFPTGYLLHAVRHPRA
jgi:hypothetical protein